MKRILFLSIFFTNWIYSQTISSSLPTPLNKKDNYLFYLHGALVTVAGDNAINQSFPEWGAYEYTNILDSLKRRGFNVISERRLEPVPDSFYITQLANQVDSLLQNGINPRNILVIGASAGWHIVLHASAILKNNSIRYVIMGGCWPETYKDYEQITIYGQFLSIIETSDPHGSCLKIFKGRMSLKHYKEIRLTTGLSHGFIHKGRKEWLEPVMKWYQEN